MACYDAFSVFSDYLVFNNYEQFIALLELIF